MTSPLSAQNHTHRWRLLGLEALVIGMIVALGVSFLVSVFLIQKAGTPGMGWGVLQFLLLPLLLLVLGGVLMFRSVRFYAYAGHTEMNQQIDSNRLALMELATHQLGAPLATFRWWAELLSDPDSTDLLQSPEVQEQITQAVNRMDEIVKEMTEANHVEQGGVKVRREVLRSLRDIMQRVMDDARPRLAHHKQKLEIYLDPSLMAIQVDPKLLYGVLQELVENAMNYSPEQTTIRIRASNEGGKYAQITVSDEGYGIPPQDLSHITEKFTRASNASKYKPVGNGLGLFIAKGIIQNFGGELWVESRLGKGTRINFTLPFDPSQQATAHPSRSSLAK